MCIQGQGKQADRVECRGIQVFLVKQPGFSYLETCTMQYSMHYRARGSHNYNCNTRRTFRLIHTTCFTIVYLTQQGHDLEFFRGAI